MNEKKRELEKLQETRKIQMNEVRLTDEKMGVVRLKIKDSISILDDLNLRKEEIEKVINNANVIEVITVDDDWNKNLSNGLMSLKGDLLMKLFANITHKQVEKIRIIIGMTADFYDLSKGKNFYLTLKNRLIWSKLHKSEGIEVSNGGKTAKVVGGNGPHVIIICNNKITQGIVSVSIEIVAMPFRYGYIIGLLPKLPKNFREGFKIAGASLGWELHDWVGSKGIFWKGSKVTDSLLTYSTGDVVTMCVDIDKGDLVYRVNGKKCAELKNVSEIKEEGRKKDGGGRGGGVYLAVQMYNPGAEWTIVSEEEEEKAEIEM